MGGGGGGKQWGEEGFLISTSLFTKGHTFKFWLSEVVLWQPIISPPMVQITTLWKECFNAASTQLQIVHWLRNQKFSAM